MKPEDKLIYKRLAFWYRVAKYEMVNGDYPFDGNLKDDARKMSDVDHKLEKMEFYFQWMAEVCANARQRLARDVDIEKWNSLEGTDWEDKFRDREVC